MATVRGSPRILFGRHGRIEGPLDAERRKRLMKITGRCPVHRTLESEIEVRTFERPI